LATLERNGKKECGKCRVWGELLVESKGLQLDGGTRSKKKEATRETSYPVWKKNGGCEVRKMTKTIESGTIKRQSKEGIKGVGIQLPLRKDN